MGEYYQIGMWMIFLFSFLLIVFNIVPSIKKNYTYVGKEWRIKFIHLETDVNLNISVCTKYKKWGGSISRLIVWSNELMFLFEKQLAFFNRFSLCISQCFIILVLKWTVNCFQLMIFHVSILTDLNVWAPKPNFHK